MFTALLPMKLNSERVPNKNFKEIAGRPLYQWMLETLLSSSFVDKIIINTDAPFQQFDNYSDHSRVHLRKRSQELCGDEVSMNLIIKNDIDSDEADNFIMTHSTNPLISKETLESAIETYIKNKASGFDSLFSATKIHGRFYDVEAKAINHDPKKLIRTQDLQPYYLENSCLYIFSRQSFFNANARIGLRPLLYETPTIESIDIDTQAEWQIAEALLGKRIKYA